VSEAARTVNGPTREPAGHGVRSPARRGLLRYRLAVQVRRFDDVVAFREVATPYLVRDEARHNLLLGISTTLMQRPDLYEAFDLWVVTDEDRVTAVALRTHPLNLVLSRPANDAALDMLVDRLLQEGQLLPGVVAALPELETFVGAWTSENGVDATRVLRHGIYELREVQPIPAAPGNARLVTPDDADRVIPWIVAFAKEALPEDDDTERQIRFAESRLAATDDAGLWFWEDRGRPVSISGFGGATPNGMRIGPVYTPPELRGRGYATTLVAEQSRWLLGTGRTLCFLYADLDNPTSNALYRRIGYRMNAEAGEVRFDPRDAA
jgi:predicted GNAT family acetyltransferase